MTEALLTFSRFQLEELLESVGDQTGVVRIVWRPEDFPEESDFYIQKEFRLMPQRALLEEEE